MHQEIMGQQDFLLTFWTEESIFLFSRCRHHAAQIVESNELKGTTFYLGYSKVTKLLIVGNVVSWLSGIIMACSNYCSSGTLWFRRSSFSKMLENVAGPLSFLSAQQWLTRPGAFRGRFAPLCAFFWFFELLFVWIHTSALSMNRGAVSPEDSQHFKMTARRLCILCDSQQDLQAPTTTCNEGHF